MELLNWIITATQDEESFFEDYARAVIASEQPPLPPTSMRLGKVNTLWFEGTPGHAHILATGGTITDQEYACKIVEAQLAPYDITRVHYTFNWDHSDKQIIKEANWQEIEAKAKRLIQAGKVHMLRNAPNVIAAYVEGDHGDYTTEISRDDPNSQAISLWSCGCKWDQFAWQRTRQWKKYEGRPCAHVLATYWLSHSLPKDEEPEQGPPGENEASPFGQQEVPMGSGMIPPATAPTPQKPGLPNQTAPTPEGTVPGQAPEEPGILPPYPGDPARMPAINPVSVPGQKPQTPLNPIQNPGGTFSHVAAQQFVNGDMVMNKQEEPNGTLVGLGGGGRQAIPLNSIGEVLGTDPMGLVNVYFAGPQAAAGNLEPHGVTAWFWPNELSARPDVPKPGPAIRRRT